MGCEQIRTGDISDLHVDRTSVTGAQKSPNAGGVCGMWAFESFSVVVVVSTCCLPLRMIFIRECFGSKHS